MTSTAGIMAIISCSGMVEQHGEVKLLSTMVLYHIVTTGPKKMVDENHMYSSKGDC